MIRVIKDHLVLPNTGNIPIQMLPGVKASSVNGKEWLAVPHTVEVSRFLRNLGVPAPSPIRYKYGFPGQHIPFKHQVTTAEFLTLNSRAFVTSSMGSGKTAATGWAADYLMTEGSVTRALVVAPLSTLQRVWGDMFFFDFPHRSFAVLHGDRAKRRAMLSKPYDFYIINPDGLKSVLDMLTVRDDINLIIVDEIAEYRNQRTDKWDWLRKIITADRKAWGLTGAPTPQAPTDAYAQVKLLCPQNLGNLSFTRFKNMVMHQVSTFKWVPRPDAMEHVHRILTPAIRFRKEDCIDLPPTTWQDRDTPLSKDQHQHYDALVKHSLTNIDGTKIKAVNAAVLLQKLVQAACGVVYGEDGARAHIDAGPRIKVLLETIQEAEGKVIVFVPFTGVLESLASVVAKRTTVAVVNGSVSAGKRNQIFSDFQRTADPRVLIAHPRTMAHGLSLTAASTIIWYAPYGSHAIYEQACERVARPGQTMKTSIVHISGAPVERRIYAALRERKQMQDVLLDMLAKVA